MQTHTDKQAYWS